MQEMAGEFVQVVDIEVEPFDDDLVLMSPLTRQVLSLNETAAVLWEALKWRVSADELAQMMLEAFPGRSAEKVTLEVNTLLGELSAAGLIKRLPGCSD